MTECHRSAATRRAILIGLGLVSASPAMAWSPALRSVVLSSRGPSAAALAAARVRASAARGITPITQVLSPAPTIAAGNSTSTLTGASGFGPSPNLPTDGTKFAALGGVWTNVSSVYYPYGMASSIGSPTNRRITQGGLRFRTSAPAIDLATDETASHVVYVTDFATGVRKRASANDVAGPGSGQFGVWTKYTFSGSADRIVEIFENASPNHIALRGVGCTSGYTLTPPPVDPAELRIVIVGDSHADHQGDGATNAVRLAYPDFLGERLGTANVWCQGIGGRGFLNPGSLAKYRDSLGVGDLATSLVGKADIVILAGTTNDDVALNAAYTDAAIQAEVQAAVAVAMAAQPAALIIVPGPFGRTISPTPNPHVTPQSRYDAIKAGVAAAAAGDPRVLYIDNSPSGTPWITAGNAATLIGTGGTHLTNAGMTAVGYALGDAILAAVALL